MIHLMEGAFGREAGAEIGDIEELKGRDPAMLYPRMRALEGHCWAEATGMMPSTLRLLPRGADVIGLISRNAPRDRLEAGGALGPWAGSGAVRLQVDRKETAPAPPGRGQLRTSRLGWSPQARW
jgi:hypothetical protein